MRNLILVLGDQLDPKSAAFDGFEAGADAVWMAEAADESTKVWSTKARIAMFVSAMRHFRDDLRRRGWTVVYHEMGAHRGFAGALRASVKEHGPQRLVMVQAGEWGVQQQIEKAARALKVPLDVREDRHFYCTPEEFAEHARSRRSLRMEFFYREMRKKLGVLLTRDGEPAGGAWNYDSENREAFGEDGPGRHKAPRRFKPDAITRGVIEMVESRFEEHPGSLDAFDWPVTATQARQALRDFVAHRLPHFGRFQDAMWTDEPWLYHSRLSAALNLKLLDPRDVVAAAEEAYSARKAPLAAVEGFIRQILGWREYVRGVYWLFMPEYLERNDMKAREPLPPFYWTGETDMQCLREALGQTLRYGYAHHIQRLMVTGLFALLYGVDPKQVHAWYLAVYVDAVEWVELPNVLGMSQYADGGVMASKPYVATGKYIQRMSNYCGQCQYDPAIRTGPNACPFSTLYWDYLLRHESSLKRNQRMSLQVRNLRRVDRRERGAIRKQAQDLRARYANGR